MRDAAKAANVQLVTGDTKVVEKGKADGCYINTAGVGLIERDVTLGVSRGRPGEAIIVSGRLVAVVPGDEADHAVAAMRGHPLGEQAAVIGHVRAEQPGIVQLKTAFGGTRIVDLLVGDPLPRIC